MNIIKIILIIFCCVFCEARNVKKLKSKRKIAAATTTAAAAASQLEFESIETTESIVAATTAIATTAAPIDYCSPELCPKGKRHIACQNNTLNLNRSCPNNTVLVDLSNYAQYITFEHNSLRNQLASGELKRLPRAARMAMMSWSDELATVASFNSMICDFKYDDCRNTPNFRNSGQNLALLSIAKTDAELPWKSLYADLISNGIHAWWNESANCTKEIMYKFPKEIKAVDYRNFGVMAWENNTHVGCAAVHYSQKSVSHFKLTCNYAVNYIPERQVYHFKGSTCKTGYNKRMNRLCSTNETFNETS